MKTLILGAQGQLGRDLSRILPGSVLTWTRQEFDFTTAVEPDASETLLQQFREIKPDVVVNCAAYNLVDQAELEPELAFRVNALAVRLLADVCRSIDCKFVQISTDYVFGHSNAAKNLQPLSPASPLGPVSVYGTSKATAELLTRAYCANHLIVRTCGLYGIWGTGGKGGNFIETMIKLAAAQRQIKVVNDQICTPSFTHDVAEIIGKLIAKDATGTMHVTNSGQTTWYDLAGKVFELQKLEADLQPISSKEYGARAARPRYSVLDCSSLLNYDIAPLRPWEEAVAAYLEQRGQRA